MSLTGDVERTLVLIKPDAVRRGLVGEIISRFERKGLTIEAMDLRTMDAGARRRSTTPSTWTKPFYPPLKAVHDQRSAGGAGALRRRARSRWCGR